MSTSLGETLYKASGGMIVRAGLRAFDQARKGAA